MSFKQIHSFISFPHLLKLLVGLALGIQIIIITYNHISGYSLLAGYSHFLAKLIIGASLSIIGGFLIAYPDLFLIQHMNKIAPWENSILKRITVELLLTALIGSFAAILLTSLSNSVHEYHEELASVFIGNILIFIVVNITIVIIFEAWIFFIESDRAKQKAKYLQEELAQIKFEVLKSQINPHFMFNSLNVLSGLINTDVKKAQLFIDEFSQIYRYVLETVENPVTSLKKEMDFMRSYFFLQQIRYGKTLHYSIDVPADSLKKLLPPLSLQVLLENAIKHNIVNESKPLQIEISVDGSSLIVKNNYQPKQSSHSTGLGLKNLVKRYKLISKLEPSFNIVNDYYIATIPLINSD